MPAPRKKITYIHNEKPDEKKTATTTYFKTLGDFFDTMEARKKNLYPHLCIELVEVEDIEVDLYEHAYREDSRYNYN